MTDPFLQQVIHECLQETQSFGWDEEDVFYSACGAVLKQAEAEGHEITPELLAAIQVTVRQEMKQ